MNILTHNSHYCSLAVLKKTNSEVQNLGLLMIFLHILNVSHLIGLLDWKFFGCKWEIVELSIKIHDEKMALCWEKYR